VSATPIILNGDSVAASDVPEVIIPKINVQIPVVYDQAAVDEAAIQGSLEQGVVHYSTTVTPGQQGNSAIFGHSSNNIFNKGKYKLPLCYYTNLYLAISSICPTTRPFILTKYLIRKWWHRAKSQCSTTLKASQLPLHLLRVTRQAPPTTV